jgi:hypothetical protein
VRFEDFIARFDKRTKTARGFMVRCPAHDDGKSSLSVGRAKDGGVLLKCFAGCEAAGIVGAMGLEMKDLFAAEAKRDFKPYKTPPPKPKSEPLPPGVKPEIEKIYSYTDALGRELYQALRLKPKSFRQRHSVNGKWIWTMDGVERVLYRLPEVVKSETVWIVEGEKDADNLVALGFCATCNVGGAGKWLDGYTDTLKGKDVVICGDNDEPGRKHVELVFDSVANQAKSVRIVKVPGGKDISDFIEGMKSDRPAREVIETLFSEAVPHVGGVKLPVYSMAEIEPHYDRLVNQPSDQRIDLGNWLPSFRGRVRPLTPGSLVLIQGDTGIGKTNILQSIAEAFRSVFTLMFEMELPKEDMFERFCASRLEVEGREIEDNYRRNGPNGAKVLDYMFPKLFICPESKLTIERIEAIAMKSELKMGEKPLLLLVDYAQLIAGKGQSRYDRASAVAEGLKVLAKDTGTVVFVTSQIDRASAKENSNGLHSAKDSGSLENSAGLVLGVDRDPEDRNLLIIKVLKATKGGAGLVIECDFDGARSRITERGKYQEQEQ